MVLDFLIDFVKTRQIRIRRICILGLIVILPLLVQEVVFAIINHLFPGKGAMSIISFFLYQKGSVSQPYNVKAGLYFFFDMIVKTDGLIWSLLYIGSLFVGIGIFAANEII